MHSVVGITKLQFSVSKLKAQKNIQSGFDYLQRVSVRKNEMLKCWRFEKFI
jgi:hypothetical protein